MQAANDDGRAPRILVVGGGFAGAYCARGLRRHAARAQVRLVDRNNYLLFYPLLIEAGTGNLEPRHTVVSLRAFLPGTHFVQASATEFDLDARRVTVQPVGAGEPLTLAYDHLVLALGATTRLPPVPGLSEHGVPMKSLVDAITLRNRAIALLEAAQLEPDPVRRRALLHFVVVGASLTGAEVAGELDVFLKQATSPRYGYRGRDELRITLVEREPRILGALDADLADYAARILARRGIDVRTSRSVVRLGSEEVVLDGDEVLGAHTCVWCAGIAPHPVVARTGVPVDALGYIRCTPDLRVEGRDDVWAIGDCASNPDPSGRPYPATAQHAVQEGRHLAKNLARVLAGGAPLPFRAHNRGTIAALGCRTAVARVFGVRLSGFAAWWLWRTVYLLKMPGFGRKLRVALDWSMNLLFRREIVHIDVTRPGARSPATAHPDPRGAADPAPVQAPAVGAPAGTRRR